MANGKTQSLIFTREVLPSLFHSISDQFILYLSRDGNQFLRFYWDKAGEKLAAADRESSFGLNYDIREPFKYVTVALITLPKPQVIGEAYYVGLIFRPLRRTPFLGISDTTKVITLEYAGDAEGNPQTILLEIDRKLAREQICAGPPPQINAFFDAICNLLSGKLTP
jgi:hypothetical protein